MVRGIFFIIFASLFVNCGTKGLIKTYDKENLIKDFLTHFLKMKMIEPKNDTVFVMSKWQDNRIIKYLYIENKLETTYKTTKCDNFQKCNNCINLYDFEFSKNNEFEKVFFELTNGSTKNGYIKKEEWGLDYKITSVTSR